jgi:glycolate oxidase iron-sulfur subunit
MQIRGKAEALLLAAGHGADRGGGRPLCCGSAGTYSILQPALYAAAPGAQAAVAGPRAKPQVVARRANIGCLTHLQAGASVPVRHWIELLE